MEKYKKEKILGTGTFGTVWLIKSQLSRVHYTLKEIDMSSLTEAEKKRSLNEVLILSKLKHKNIIRYKDAIIEHAAGRLSIVMEYADGGDLAIAISKQRGTPFSEDIILSWFIQISLALQYMHFQNILHRDLKTQNIYLKKDKTIKVGDFGISRVLVNSADLAGTAIGTPYYMSPEILKRKYYNHKSDMWALGCVLFEISALKLPFRAEHFFHLIKVVLEGKREEFPDWCSPLIRELVQALLSDDPDKRPSTDEILGHLSLQPYLANYVIQHASLHGEMSVVNPRKGPTCEIPKNTKDFFGKRSSDTTPKVVKQRKRILRNEALHPKSRSTGDPCYRSLKNPDTPLKNQRTQDKEHSLPKKNSLNITFSVTKPGGDNCEQSSSPQKLHVKGEGTSNDIVGGYHSAETFLSSSDEKGNGDPFDEKPTDNSENQRLGASGMSELHDTSFGFETFSRNRLRYSDHNCQHSQCNQCMIDMLWKNRIRGSASTSGNQSEYLKLKNKLSLIFKNELFQKVYQSMLYDWNESEDSGSRVAIKGFLKTLNYEQVQHLPLMMQLIQLDLHRNQLDEGKI